MAPKTSRSFDITAMNYFHHLGQERGVRAESQRALRSHIWDKETENSRVTIHKYYITSPLRLQRLTALVLAIGGHSAPTPPPAQAQVVKFARNEMYGTDAFHRYDCNTPGDMSGDYIPANAAPQQQADGRVVTQGAMDVIRGCADALREAGRDFATHNPGAAHPNMYELHENVARALLKELDGPK